MGFAEEALQRPCAALLDLDGYGRERYDPTQVRDISLVSEAGHIVFDPVVPCNQGGGALQANGPIGSNQSSTGEDRLRLQNKECKGRYEDSKSFQHPGFLLLSGFRIFINHDDRV